MFIFHPETTTSCVLAQSQLTIVLRRFPLVVKYRYERLTVQRISLQKISHEGEFQGIRRWRYHLV